MRHRRERKRERSVMSIAASLARNFFVNTQRVFCDDYELFSGQCPGVPTSSRRSKTRMKTRFSFPRGLVAALGATLAFSLSPQLMAQGRVEIGSLKFDELPSPDLGGTKNKSFKPKDWLEVEAGLTVPAMNREQQATGFVDKIVVKWYVAVKEKASGRTMLLTKDITHLNVPVDEEVYSSVYLSPNTLKRLTGSDRAGKNVIWGVARAITINGTTETFNSQGTKDWWKSGNLSRTDKVPLLNKNETPFKSLWWDRYAQIQERR